MNIIFTSIAKEDIQDLAKIDIAAYQRLQEWLLCQANDLPSYFPKIQLRLEAQWELFSIHLSEVHRLVYATQEKNMIVLQCRFYF